MHLLSSRAHGLLLQGASSDNGGSEEALGGGDFSVGHCYSCSRTLNSLWPGLYSGHAYSINDCRKTSNGEVLVQVCVPGAGGAAHGEGGAEFWVTAGFLVWALANVGLLSSCI